VHGEAHHLTCHANFAKAHGVAHVAPARNGMIIRLAPGAPETIGTAPSGLLFKDGDVVIDESDGAVRDRAKLSYVGVISIALALGRNGEMVGDPDVVFAGVPKRGKFGEDMSELIDETLFATFEGLPRARRRDADTVSTAIERAVRGAVFSVWGKKPVVHVMVVST
jgi:ribonuclease J